MTDLIELIEHICDAEYEYKGNDRVHLMNWKFKIHWCRWNKKPFSKLHILIRTPLLCLERNNGGTAIGNKYVIWFIK